MTVIVFACLIPVLASALLSTAPAGQKSYYWQNPVPQGNPLYGVATQGAADVWAVGNAGTLIHSGDGGTVWESQDSGTGQQLRDIDFADASTGWAVGGLTGQVPAIAKTGDGGASWSLQSNPAALGTVLRGVAAASASTAWAVGDAGRILGTTDGGSTWTAQVSGTAQALHAVSAVDATRVWASGNAATIVSTTDGSTWSANTVASISPTMPLFGVSFADANTGWAVGGVAGQLPAIIKTTDGGSTWTTQTATGLPAGRVLRAVTAVSPTTAWIVGDTGVVLYTTDGGTTWNAQYGVNIALYAVDAPSTSVAHVVGNTGTMIRTADAGLTWTSQAPGTTVAINDISFTDSDNGWLAGASGLVMRTTDGGVTWSNRTTGGVTAWQGIDFAGTSTGWVVGATGRIRRTTDGGDTWSGQTSGVTVGLQSVSAIDTQTAYACGASGTLLKTVDGGANWSVVPTATLGIASTVTLYDVFFVDSLNGWICGTASTVRRTTDGGLTWTAQAPGTSTYRDIYFTDASNGVLVGSTNNAIRYTTNGGVTWSSATRPNGAYYGVVMGDSLNGWAVGATGAVVRTTDGGVTWTSQSSNSNLALYAVSAAGPDRGWLSGATGTIRRTTDGGANWDSTTYGTAQNLNSVSVVDSHTAWTAGNGGTILRTDDGLTWMALASRTTNNLLGIDFVDATHGWAGGVLGTITATVDGTTWALQPSGTAQQINAIDFVDTQTGFYVANNATIGRTTDGGASWIATQPASIPPTMPLLAVSFVDSSTGWAVGGLTGHPAGILKTVDGGLSWSAQAAPVVLGRVLRGVSAVSTSTAWIVGDNGATLVTTDGSTWSTYALGTAARLRDVEFLDANHGWIVGENPANGTSSIVRRTTDGGLTWTTQLPGTINQLAGVDFATADAGFIVGATGTLLATTDSSAPNTTIDFDPAVPDGVNGWYVTAPLVTLTTDEPANTYYSLNGTLGPWTPYSAAFEFGTETSVTIGYYSIDPGGNRETTQTAQVRLDATAPTTPTLLAASVTSTTATLTWAPSFDATSGVDYYEVLQDGSAVGTSAVPAITLSGLTPETETTFTVRAYDFAGNVSGESQPAQEFTLGELPRPPAVLAASVANRGRVYLAWGEVTGTVGPVSYRVWRSLNGVAHSPVATVTASYPGSWIDTGVVSPATVSYLVSVIDARGEGPASEATASSSATLTVLPAPTGLRALAATSSVETSWSALDGAIGYLVYRAITSTAAPALLTTPTPLPAPSFEDTSVLVDTAYWYRVAALDASGTVGELSEPVHVLFEGPTAAEVPHGSYDPLTDDCGLCHRAHTSANTLALLTTPGDNEIPLCMSCHDGTSAPDVFDELSDATMTSRHPVQVDGSPTLLRCGSCHTPHDDNSTSDTLDRLLYAEGGVRSGNALCYGCHGATALSVPRGDLSTFEGSGHASGVAPPADGAKVVCLSCHEGHATREPSLVPYAPDDRCVRCHSADAAYPGASDIKATLGGVDPGTRHDLLEADRAVTGSRISCSNCHEPHTSAPGTPTVDPDSPTNLDGWTGTVAALCLRCHDDALPTSADTSGWAEAPLGPGGSATVSNIATAWPGDVHGGAVSSPSFLRPDMGWVAGDEMSCETCHEPHGSVNRWALRESVTATMTGQIAEGLFVVPAGTGVDLRFFCGACHIVGPTTHPDATAGGADLSVWPIDCNAGGCHTHAGTGL